MVPQRAVEVAQLRADSYNATVSEIRRLHDELMILRVRPDTVEHVIEPGQYVVLGLGYWEPRMEGAQAENLDDRKQESVVKRAYSVTCGMIDGAGQLLTLEDDPDLEFYICVVKQADKPPALTPRLYCLEQGDRLLLATKPHGHYTIDRVRPQDNVIMIATGTGEAPHNAMLAELLKTGHEGQIRCVTCVRRKQDLGYLEAHRHLEQQFGNYRYVTMTTREPENLDESRSDFVGKKYVQDVFNSSEVDELLGIELDPNHTQVYLCGNPAMIGVPLRTRDRTKRYPTPLGMVEVLERRGFQIDQPHQPGNIHFEKYW